MAYEKQPQRNPDRIILAGFVLMVLFWIIDSLIDASFEGRSIVEELFDPHTHEIAIRLLAITVQVLFILYIRRILARRRKLEAELAEAKVRVELEKARSEAILENMGDAISIQDTELRIIYQNRAHREMMGEHLGEYCYKAYQRKDDVCPGCHLALSFRDGKVHFREASAQTNSGLKHVEIISTPLRDVDGTIIAGIEAVRDVSERHEAAETIRRQAFFLQRLIDTIPNPIFYKDANGLYTGCNAAFEALTGLPRNEIVGKTVHDLFPRELAEIYHARDLELLHYPGVQSYEATVRYGDGTLHDLIFYKATFAGVDNKAEGLVGVAIDITDRKHAEEEIRRLNEELTAHALELSATNRELEAFSYSLSHDLRTPLTKMYAAAQILEEIYADRLDDDGRMLIGNLCHASESMEELIEAMLLLFRVTRSEMSRETVGLSHLAMEIAAELRSSERGREVEFVIAPDLTVEGDAHLLKVALENLLANAWKYTRQARAPRIEFGVAEVDGERAYFVRDNGAGFDMQDAEKLFKPFKRLHTANDFPGTGIGLATVQRIVERHGGRVWGIGVPGQGATFYFTLK